MRGVGVVFLAWIAVGCSSEDKRDATGDLAALDVWQCLDGAPYPKGGSDALADFAIDPPWTTLPGMEGVEVVDVTATRLKADGTDFHFTISVQNTTDDWLCPSVWNLAFEAREGTFDPGGTSLPTQAFFAGQAALDMEDGRIEHGCIAPGRVGVADKWIQTETTSEVVGVEFRVDQWEPDRVRDLQTVPGVIGFTGYEVAGRTLKTTFEHAHGDPMHLTPVVKIATKDADGRFRSITYHHGETIVLGPGEQVVFTDDHHLFDFRTSTICAELDALIPIEDET